MLSIMPGMIAGHEENVGAALTELLKQVLHFES